MDLILVASPDKISLSMFTDFLRFVRGKSYPVLGVHYLMTDESIKLAFDDFVQKNGHKGIITYYSRKNKNNLSPTALIPGTLIEASDVVVWFDLVSVDPVVLKGSNEVLMGYKERWKANIQKMSTY